MKEIRTIFIVILTLWIIELINEELGRSLRVFGVHPREIAGLPGIVLSPLLHADSSHLLHNTVPLAILGYLALLGGRTRFWTVVVVSAIVSGIGMWLFGAAGVHYGASGVVFGLLGYLLADGWYRRNSQSVVITALIVLVCFGGTLWQLVSFESGVSWTGHFFGFLGGVFVAKALAETKNNDAES